MGKSLRKLDLIALTASKSATDKLHAVLLGLREDAASGLVGNAEGIFHKAFNQAAASANATDLASALTLVNELRGLTVSHLASAGFEGDHRAASAATIAAPAATNLATAQTLANELKADYNTHLSEAGVHLVNDGANATAAANASDLPTLLVLANELKSDFNTHIAGVMSTPVIEQAN